MTKCERRGKKLPTDSATLWKLDQTEPSSTPRDWRQLCRARRPRAQGSECHTGSVTWACPDSGRLGGCPELLYTLLPVGAERGVTLLLRSLPFQKRDVPDPHSHQRAGPTRGASAPPVPSTKGHLARDALCVADAAQPAGHCVQGTRVRSPARAVCAAGDPQVPRSWTF